MDLSHLTHRARRAYLKKVRRKRIRQKAAQLREQRQCSPTADEDGELELIREKQREAENLKWLERERIAQIQFEAKKNQSISESKTEDGVKACSSKLDKIVPNDDVPDLPPWHHPPPPTSVHRRPQSGKSVNKTQENCSFFRKTGCCRYGLMCSRQHTYPSAYDSACLIEADEDEDVAFDHSVLVLRIHQMFVHYYLNSCSSQNNAPEDQDSGLEFDESQFLSDYHDFYRDVRFELETKWGKIAALRTCRNRSDHLRGSVYVEFARGPTATWDAAEACSGRWFAGHQLNCTVVRLAGGWKEAICGLYHRGKCPKGDDNCNFLHVFLNPEERVSDLQRALYLQIGELPSHQRDHQCRNRMMIGAQHYNHRSYRNASTPNHRHSISPNHSPDNLANHKRPHSKHRTEALSTPADEEMERKKKSKKEKKKKHKHTRKSDKRRREREDSN